MHAFNRLGFSTLGIKPIASGCNPQSEDALRLMRASSIKLPYEEVNPLTFKPAIAPHIAAAQANVSITLSMLTEKIQSALNHPADIHLIEGVGGSHVPINHTHTMSQWVAQQKFKTIIVVGIRLGCINHAILTLRALIADNVSVVGWIANCVDGSMTAAEENIRALDQWLSIPRIATIKHNASAHKMFTDQTLLSLINN